MKKLRHFNTLALMEEEKKNILPPNLEKIIEISEREPPKCKKFGCGKTLSHTETLFGNFCFFHSEYPSLTIDAILSL